MTNKLISSEVKGDNGGQLAVATQKPRNYYIPAYSVRLVRDGSVKAETKLADSPQRVAAIVRAYWGEGELDREHFVCLMRPYPLLWAVVKLSHPEICVVGDGACSSLA
jgi:hypothetical protein